MLCWFQFKKGTNLKVGILFTVILFQKVLSLQNEERPLKITKAHRKLCISERKNKTSFINYKVKKNVVLRVVYGTNHKKKVPLFSSILYLQTIR